MEPQSTFTHRRMEELPSLKKSIPNLITYTTRSQNTYPIMTIHNTIAHQRLVLSGDRERFKELLRRRLIECGWRDQVRMLCREAVKENDGKNITLDMLVTTVTPRARALVPDTVKRELLQKIKTHLLTQKE